MPFHITFICDDLHDGNVSAGLISPEFDSITETFGDMVAAVEALGWQVDLDASARATRCLCPDHARR